VDPLHNIKNKDPADLTAMNSDVQLFQNK